MWLRRSGAVRNANGQPVQAEPFNPNHRRYRTCCCHCKTFTLGFGVVEMFLICFCLVAIAPDFNTKICHNQLTPPPSPEWPNGTPPPPPIPPPPPSPQEALESTTAPMPTTVAETAQPPDSITPPLMMAQKRRRRRKRQMPLEQSPNNNMPGVLAIMAQKMSASTGAPPAQAYSMAPYAANQQPGFNAGLLLRQLTCSLTYLWISWALLQMLSIVLMCLGVKRQRWILLIPHIFLRICCALLIWLVIVALIAAFFNPPPIQRFSIIGAITMCIFLFLIFLWICLLLKSEIRCCEFVKRSAETGFSVSITRPIGPPTVSQSDSARGGDHVRRIVQSGIRKMAAQPAAAGPSAKRYQTKQQQLEESQQQENGQEMTMSTLATAGGGGTRPSTAGSLQQQQGQQQQRLGSATNAEDVLSRASRRLSGRPPSNGAEFERLEPRAEETHFGEAGGGGGGRPGGNGGGGALPPLRHTYRLGG